MTKKIKNVTPIEVTKPVKLQSFTDVLNYSASLAKPHVIKFKDIVINKLKMLLALLFFIGALLTRVFNMVGLGAVLNKAMKEVILFKKAIFEEQMGGITPSDAKIRSLQEYISKPIHFAFIAMGIAFLFFIVWGALAPIDSAAVAPGYIVSESSNKVIQHQEGGVIERILVTDGEEVHKDEILILLNDTAARAKVEMIGSQLRTAKAMEIRLNAEKETMSMVVKREKQAIITPQQAIITPQEDVKLMDGDVAVILEDGEYIAQLMPSKDAIKLEDVQIEFNDPIFNLHSPEVQKLLRTQNDLYQTNRRVVMSEISVFHQRISQRMEENKGLNHHLKSLQAQLVLMEEELKSLQSLSDKQLTAKSRLLDMKRRAEECRGSIGRIKYDISKSLEAITEDQSHITKTISGHFRDIYRELREVQGQVLELQEQYRAAKDVLERMEIKAPADGYITNLAYHTIGGVITTGNKIMEIVPKEDKLVVEARVSPRDIESIHVGLPSKIQLSAYKSKLVPRLSGVVIHVSADRIPDPHNPMQPYYYLAKVEIDQDELKNLNYNVKLIPGMPAEVFIVKGTRTMLQLLLSPLIDSFHKAFKEI